jgi:pimeloyl-ACP methyl ester carboxylesterase
MKRSRRQHAAILAGLILVGGLVLAGLWLRPRLAVGRIRTDGITSYYVYSGTDAGHEGKLPTIIFIGHLHSSPFRDLSTFKDWFDELVLLIWSGLMSDLRGDCLVDDEATWAKKRPQFLRLLDDYKKKLRLDEDRIYLTGFSSAGVYAWMLAYDHPELYAGVVPMSAPSYPRQIQEHLEAAQTLVTVVVRGEKDKSDLAGDTRTGRIIESCHSGSRFVLKPGEGHGAMYKYWRENLQYVLQFRRKDNRKMTSSREPTAASCREAFLSWAQRTAVPLPASPEEPFGERAQAALDRMLQGKRFVFLGEPDHFIVEKYPFRSLFIRYLFERGWRHVGMETGRSVGRRVDRYLETGDASCLSTEGAQSPSPTDRAIHGKTLEFLDAHEDSFHEQLRQISERRVPGTARLHYWGYDLDLGVPLASIRPIQEFLEGHAGRQVDELLSALGKLGGLSTDEQLAQIVALQSRLTADAEFGAEGMFGQLRSWLAFLHDSVAAEKRPRMNQDPRGHRLWWAQREHFLMQSLDAIVDGLGGDEKLILLGHNVHLSKDAVNLHFHPQFSSFWGLPQARAILSHANVRLMGGYYASTDLTAQADAIYFVREVKAE